MQIGRGSDGASRTRRRGTLWTRRGPRRRWRPIAAGRPAFGGTGKRPAGCSFGALVDRAPRLLSPPEGLPLGSPIRKCSRGYRPVIPPGPRWRSLPAQDHRRDAAGDRRQTGSKAEEAVPSRAGGPDGYSAFVCAVIEIQPPSLYMNLDAGMDRRICSPGPWRAMARPAPQSLRATAS